ncbi:ribosomal protein L22 [Lindgomyces ingoldianus]|uniref:Ribosomal protein L22 n=1 Tax=Lindgomyces ingoldianus TaxID=673940 RepID=A0ACB6RF56_9PLEO|nr:ribosomal protein L22 [Lindgomyces ingoldianus]KAF2477111.1 ribosomal protein L22 [Lindgomyces ingoldianus]
MRVWIPSRSLGQANIAALSRSSAPLISSRCFQSTPRAPVPPYLQKAYPNAYPKGNGKLYINGNRKVYFKRNRKASPKGIPTHASKANPKDSSEDTPANLTIADDLPYAALEKRNASKDHLQRPELPKVTLPKNSIFADISRELTPEELEAQAEAARAWELSQAKLDPAPRSRRRWERKIVIRSLRRRGRITDEIKKLRTERQLLYKSPFLPTSVKKLTKLMRQIQGMTVEEALVQLRFSKKKVAVDVTKGLQSARNEAVVARGMGLLEQPDQAEKGAGKAKGLKGDFTWDDIATEARKKREGTTIELKGGKTKVVKNPTDIYIDQAWVGKGEEQKSPEYRARGRVNLLTHRSTSFSVLLKEEKTRMRISDEIKKKRDNRKLWVPLPDRAVTSQRQYCLW